MNLSDALELEQALHQEIGRMEADLAKKRINLEFVQELVEAAKNKAVVKDESFVLTRAAMEARSSMSQFSKRSLEAAIKLLYPKSEFNIKSLERIITEWKKLGQIEEISAADGISGAIYKTMLQPKGGAS